MGASGGQFAWHCVHGCDGICRGKRSEFFFVLEVTANRSTYEKNLQWNLCVYQIQFAFLQFLQFLQFFVHMCYHVYEEQSTCCTTVAHRQTAGLILHT